MVAAQLLAFAFLVGITVCGLAGTLLELVASRPLRLGEPFLSRHKPLRSLAATALAGPLMLANDACCWTHGPEEAGLAGIKRDQARKAGDGKELAARAGV